MLRADPASETPGQRQTRQDAAVAKNVNTKTNSNQEPGFQVDAGALLQLNPGKDNQYYYKLQYNGQPLSQSGKAFADPTFPGPTKAPEKISGGGDSNDFALRLENSSLTSSSALLDSLGVKPLNLPYGGFLGQMRGAVQVTGLLDTQKAKVDHLDVGLGLETQAIHPLRRLNINNHTGITNWLIVGIQGSTLSGDDDTQEGANDSKSNGAFLATYRSLFATSFGKWVHSRAREEAQRTIDKNFATDAIAPSYIELTHNILLGNAGTLSVEDGQNSSLNKKVNDQVLSAWDSLITTGWKLQISKLDNANTFDLNGELFLKTLQTLHSQTPTNAIVEIVWEAVQGSPNVKKYYDNGIYDAQIDKALKSLLNGIMDERLFIASAKDEAALSSLNDSIKNIGNLIDIKKFIDDHADKIDKDLQTRFQNDIFLGQAHYANRLAFQKVFNVAGSVSDNTIMDITNSQLWQARRQRFSSNFFFLPDRPVVTLWLSDVGWYQAAGKTVSPSRYNNLLSTGLTYYLNPKEESRAWIRAQYQNGRDKAAPDEYKNFVALTLGLDLH